jgi:thioredoxin-disulfide reductase
MFDISVDKKPESNVFKQQSHFEMIVIGAGPAGLNAALYAKRKGIDVSVISLDVGGQLHNTSQVDNYLGIQDVLGGDLSKKFEDHCLSLGVPIKTGHQVEKIERLDNANFKVILDNDETFTAVTLIYTLGGSPRKLDVMGEDLYANKGVSYCTTCDAPFFKDQHVVVAGGGNSAAEAVIDLAAWAKKIMVVHRSQWRADQIILDQFKNVPNLEILLETQILEVLGDTMMTGLRVLDKKMGEEKVIKADGLFVEIGNIPKSHLLKDLVDLNEQGEVIVNHRQETSLEGLYAAGDVTTQEDKQIIISAAEGAKAALTATQYINHKK